MSTWKPPCREAASSCTDCEANTFSNVGASMCENCASGKYSESAASVCIDCTAWPNNNVTLEELPEPSDEAPRCDFQYCFTIVYLAPDLRNDCKQNSIDYTDYRLAICRQFHGFWNIIIDSSNIWTMTCKPCPSGYMSLIMKGSDNFMNCFCVGCTLSLRSPSRVPYRIELIPRAPKGRRTRTPHP